MSKRWEATIVYRSDSGPVHLRREIEELSEIESIVERGPDWNAIERIEIRLARHAAGEHDLTVEEAAQQ